VMHRRVCSFSLAEGRITVRVHHFPPVDTTLPALQARKQSWLYFQWRMRMPEAFAHFETHRLPGLYSSKGIEKQDFLW